MKGKKVLFLVLALILPVVIFLFLKIFGKNEFQVAILHQDGEIQAPSGCDFSYAVPYHVPDSIMMRLWPNKADSLCVLFFGYDLQSAANRISHEFADKPVRVVTVPQKMPDARAAFIRKCALLMDEHASVALVDHQHRVRGYYDGADRDEMDRLIVEMKIILKQF